jgi:hypothetical protein
MHERERKHQIESLRKGLHQMLDGVVDRIAGGKDIAIGRAIASCGDAACSNEHLCPTVIITFDDQMSGQLLGFVRSCRINVQDIDQNAFIN